MDMRKDEIAEMERKILKAMKDPTEENISNVLEGHPADLVVAMENVQRGVEKMNISKKNNC